MEPSSPSSFISDPTPFPGPEPGPSSSPLFSSSLRAPLHRVLCVLRRLLYFVSRLSLTFSPLLSRERVGEIGDVEKTGGSLNDFFFFLMPIWYFGMVDHFVVSWILNELGISVCLCNNSGVGTSMVSVKLVVC